MFKILDGHSERTISPEIEFFSVPVTHVGIESSRVVEVNTSNSIQTVPYEFRIHNSKNFLDLQRSYLLIRCSIRDEDGNHVDFTEETSPDTAPINLFGQTMFKQIQMFIGGVQVYDSSVAAPYRAYLQALLSHTPDYKESMMELAGFVKDEDPSAADSDSFEKRCEWGSDGIMEFIAPISADLFQQPRALIPWIDFRLVLYPASDTFRLEQRGETTVQYKVILEELVFMSRQITCYDSTMLAIDTMLREKQFISYKMNSIQTRSFFIANGCMDAPEHKLFSAATPSRLFCAFVASDNFNGTIGTNPFAFKDFNVSEIFLDMGSETIPLRSWKMDFAKFSSARTYLALQEVVGMIKNGDGNGISFTDFKKCPIFGFDISPNAHDPEATDLMRMGECSLRIRFSKPVQAGGIYCVCIAEFPSEMRLSYDRVPTMDSIL